MSRIVLALFVVLAVFSASSFGQKQCGPNEIYTTCGSSCEPSCAVPRATSCNYDCKIGCQCDEGFLRNSAGACVLSKDC